MAVGFGSGDGPACGSVVQAQGGQSGEVDDAGSGQDVGQDAFLSAAAGCARTPGTAGEVADLAFHDGTMLPVVLLPGRVELAALARCRAASWGWMLMTRPRRAVVQSARSGQD